MKLSRLTFWPCLFGSAWLSLAACKDSAPRATSAPATAAAREVVLPPPAAGTKRLTFGPGTSSSIEFVGRKVTGQHVGHFQRFTGAIDLDAAALEKSVVRVEIDMGSVKVEPEGLQKHLLSDEFFDVAKFPKATFSSTSVRAPAAAGGPHTITGDLDLHGERRSISFPAKITVAPDAVSANAEFSINRKEFKIVYPGAPDDLIRDDVTIKMNLRAPRS